MAQADSYPATGNGARAQAKAHASQWRKAAQASKAQDVAQDASQWRKLGARKRRAIDGTPLIPPGFD